MIIGGTMPLGRCEILDGQGVRTQFVFLGPLLVPCDSVYGSYKAAFPVHRPMKSVLYAYARWVVAPLAFGVACIASDGLGPVAIAVGIAWLALVFVAGRTFGEEARQRRLLASLVGHGAPPEILFRGTLQLLSRRPRKGVDPPRTNALVLALSLSERGRRSLARALLRSVPIRRGADG